MVYTDYFSDGLSTNTTLFVDDVFLFSAVDNMILPATKLHCDLSKINAWANQWKMSFNSDPNKEFAKSRAMRTCVPKCLRVSVIYVPTCQKRARFSFLRANVPENVPTCHKTCQCFNLACQRVKERANFSNIPITKC